MGEYSFVKVIMCSISIRIFVIMGVNVNMKVNQFMKHCLRGFC